MVERLDDPLIRCIQLGGTNRVGSLRRLDGLSVAFLLAEHTAESEQRFRCLDRIRAMSSLLDSQHPLQKRFPFAALIQETMDLPKLSQLC